MKKILFLLLCSISVHAQGVMYKATYSYEYKPFDKVKPEDMGEDYAYFEKMIEDDKQNDFYLYFSDDCVFVTSERLENRMQDAMSDRFMNTGVCAAKYDKKKKVYSWVTDFGGTEYLIEDADLPQWELTDEVKTIDNFTSRKATLTYNANEEADEPQMSEAVAWYAIDVPKGAGVGKLYVNLPGLMVYGEDERVRLKLIKLETIDASELYDDLIKQRGKKIVKDDFYKLVKETLKDGLF